MMNIIMILMQLSPQRVKKYLITSLSMMNMRMRVLNRQKIRSQRMITIKNKEFCTSRNTSKIKMKKKPTRMRDSMILSMNRRLLKKPTRMFKRITK